MTFQAFADDCSSYTLGNLTFENNADYLSVYGDIQIQRDQQGLQQLLALQQIINQAVTDLQADSAEAVTYCQVHLVEEKDGKNLMHSHSVRYQDRYVKQDGQWLIAHRVANFMISDTRELNVNA